MLRKILVITLLFSTVIAAYAQKKDKKKKKKEKEDTEQVADSNISYKEIGDPMPVMKLTTRKGKKLTEKDFNKKSNLLVMMFNPTCDHCQDQTITFEKNIDLFDKTDLVLIAAPQMIDYLEFYNNVTRYFEYPKMTVAVDSSGFIDKTFHYQALPQINVYDKNRKLIKIFTGNVEIEALKPYID